jgi:hypothetical protein
MAKKKAVTGFKTKSKKNKKAKKPKSKKCKGEKEKTSRKLGLGVQDICSALTELQVDATVSGQSIPSYESVPNSSRNNRRNEKAQLRKSAETNISRLFQKLSCSNAPKGSINVDTKSQGMLAPYITLTPSSNRLSPRYRGLYNVFFAPSVIGPLN